MGGREFCCYILQLTTRLGQAASWLSKSSTLYPASAPLWFWGGEEEEVSVDVPLKRDRPAMQSGRMLGQFSWYSGPRTCLGGVGAAWTEWTSCFV